MQRIVPERRTSSRVVSNSVGSREWPAGKPAEVSKVKRIDSSLTLAKVPRKPSKAVLARPVRGHCRTHDECLKRISDLERELERLHFLIVKIEIKRGERGPEGKPGPPGEVGETGEAGADFDSSVIVAHLKKLPIRVQQVRTDSDGKKTVVAEQVVHLGGGFSIEHKREK